MSNIVGRTVVNARLHTGYHVQGVGAIPTVLETKTWKKSLKMVKTETGLLCSVEGLHNQVFEFFIPDTNCIGLTFTAEIEASIKGNG